MGWKQRTFIRILLFVAACFVHAFPEGIQKEFRHLETHIRIWKGKNDDPL